MRKPDLNEFFMHGTRLALAVNAWARWNTLTDAERRALGFEPCGDFGPSCGEHLGRSCFTAFEAATTAETDAGCILTFQQWRRFSILDLAAGDVDHQLGELRWIAGRLRRFSDMDQ
jgi:hypothetical protein